MKFKNIRKFFEAYRAGQVDKRIVRKFLLIVGSVAGCYLIIASVVTASLLAASNDVRHTVRNPYTPRTQESIPSVVNGHQFESSQQNSDDDDDGGFFRPPSRTNVLVLGVDDGNLADVIIVGSFERDTGNINLLHIPRDTYTVLPENRVASMRDNGIRGIRNDGVLKLNHIRSLGGRQFGIQYMQEQLSESLGIELHYFVEVNIRAFREIVDLVGGVEIEVPRRMYYSDPCQDLFIDIPAGVHLMDGWMAEHFVRYREYASADIGRISAQQQFMTQMFRQVLRRDNIMRDPIHWVRIALNHVETDIGFDLFPYLPYVANLNPDRIFTYTLPGVERRVHGISYWIPDNEQIPEVIDRMFFGIVPGEAEVVPVLARPAVSRNARISVLNGTQIGGVARTVADQLDMSGYQIAHIGIHSGTRQYQTRINVREAGLGEDLLDYFQNAVITVDNRMSADFDIVIIVGRSEQ